MPIRKVHSLSPGFDPPRVDPEFRDLVPDVIDKKDDQKLLAMLLKEGECSEAIKVWDEPNIIVDGHRRFRLCTEHCIPYTVEYRSFPSRLAVKEWIREHQLYGKRNLTDRQRTYLIGLEFLEEVQKPEPGDSAGKVAKKNKVSRRTVTKAAKLAKAIDAHEAATPGVKKRLLAGESSASKIIETAPIFCPRCIRVGRPVVDCERCKDAREAVKLKKKKPTPESLFDTPAGRPKKNEPPPAIDEFDELKKRTIQLSTLFTKFLNGGVSGELTPVAERLQQYFAWCGLLWIEKGKPMRFIATEGVVHLIELAGQKGPIVKQSDVLESYKKACGAVPYVPPRTAYYRKQRGE